MKSSTPAATDEADVTSEFQALIDEVLQLRGDLVGLSKDSMDVLEQVDSSQRESAVNLLHYMALRSRDLRSLQMRLARIGLSSLGRAESHVLSAVDAVLGILHRAVGCEWRSDDPNDASVDLERGRLLLRAHTDAVLGPVPSERGVAIMVTMSREAANDYSLVHHLLEHGMDCMRINCAHDNEDAWARMIEHLRLAERATGRRCRVLMDLAGPKLRTGPLEPGPCVIKVKPTRDAFGRVTRPARIWFSAQEGPRRRAPTQADVSLELPEAFLKTLTVGDRLVLSDARGRERVMDVSAIGRDGVWVQSWRTCYFTEDVRVRLERDAAHTDAEAAVSGIGPLDPVVPLTTGDLLILTRDLIPGKAAICDSAGHVLNPATIGCTLPQVFDDVRAGERVWIDDGRIGGVIERKEPDQLHIRVTNTRVRGAKLAADKGINLPDSRLRLAAITDKDRADLHFVAAHADMVALSFANTVDDVRTLRSLLSLGDRQPAVILKIETKRGFENLPAMLLEAMKAPRCGVMIARGDLAVECGFERLAEVQEEILWVCEAAHVPVIWATQVLESLAKDGQPSRAEITDAAMSHRAECVMLNKGPYVTQAVHVLDDILRRMHGHQTKKRAMLRELQLVSGFRQARKANESITPVHC